MKAFEASFASFVVEQLPRFVFDGYLESLSTQLDSIFLSQSIIHFLGNQKLRFKLIILNICLTRIQTN